VPDLALAARLAAARLDWIVPDWPAPRNVRAVSTTRQGQGGRDADFSPRNPGVAAARAQLRAIVPREPLWLAQDHGRRIASGDAADSPAPHADGAVARTPGNVCAVLTADCLPLLLCDDGGSVVAAVHAGWRGLSSGVIEQTLRVIDRPRAALLAYLGPAIGPAAYEVGIEVREAFIAADATGGRGAAAAFAPGRPGKFHADLYALARLRLARSGVERVYGGGYCTYAERERFYSFRRDGATGRMASLIWMEA
jgi:hypothetical protein